MEKNRSSKTAIIRISYHRLVLVNIATLVAINLCGFVDNLVISLCLDTHALAAVGYFSPVSVIMGLPSVVILGAGLLCGNFIGAGRQDKVNALFTSSFWSVGVFCAVFSAALFFARSPLSVLLGAKEGTTGALEDYIAGFAPGIPFACLGSLMMSLAAFNDEIKRSYAATAVMFFGNLALDILLAEPLGMLGIGLASTGSSLAAFLILLPPYLNKKMTVHLEPRSFDAGLVLQASKRGLPALLFTAGMLVKNGLINYSLNRYVGYEGIAVAGILASFCGIAGTLTGGCTNAFAGLASLYYGEEDREGMTDAFRTALRTGVLSTAILVAVIMLLRKPLAGFFFDAGTNGCALAENMFLLGFIFLPVNVVINLIMNGWKAQGRMLLVNIVSFLEVSMIGILAAVTVPGFGSNAVWLANTWSDLLALGILLVSVFVWKKRVTLKSEDLLKLPDDFGAGKDEAAEYAVSAPEEIPAVSQSIIEFCRGRGTDARKAYLAGLCVEEITKNILTHGVRSEHNHVAVRVVCRNADGLTIRVQDDCRRFDPRERMKMYNPESPEKNIGLRMVAGMATDVDYYNNAGINTLIMKV